MNTALIFSGILFVCIALIPSEFLLNVLQVDSIAASPNLDAGAVTFRAAVGVLGVYLLILARFAPRETARTNVRYYDTAPASATAILIAILLLASALRFYGLGRGIWFDEMLMHVRYMHLSPLQILTTFDDSNNHVLYTFLSRLSIAILGDNVSAIRLPAVLFGVASIAAIYFFSRRVMSWQEALVAALFLTVSYHHVWFSQNARGYTALLFFSLASSSLLLDAIRTGSAKHWISYAALGALGAFTHLTIAFLFVGHFLFFLFKVATGARGEQSGRSNFWIGIFYGFGVLTLLTLTLYAIMLPDMLGGTLLSSGLQSSSEWSNPFWALKELLSSLSLGFSGAGVIAAGGLVVLAGMFSFLRRDGSVVAFFVIPVGLAVLLMASIGYTLFPRFFFFAMGFAIVLVTHGATAFGTFAARALRIEGRPAAWIAIAPAILLLAASTLSLPNAYYPKQNFGASISYIEERLADGDEVAVVGISDMPYNSYFGKGWERIDKASDLDALLGRGNRVWVVYTLPVQARSAYPDVLERLGQDFEVERTFYGTLSGGEIIISVSNEP